MALSYWVMETEPMVLSYWVMEPEPEPGPDRVETPTLLWLIYVAAEYFQHVSAEDVPAQSV